MKTLLVFSLLVALTIAYPQSKPFRRGSGTQGRYGGSRPIPVPIEPEPEPVPVPIPGPGPVPVPVPGPGCQEGAYGGGGAIKPGQEGWKGEFGGGSGGAIKPVPEGQIKVVDGYEKPGYGEGVVGDGGIVDGGIVPEVSVPGGIDGGIGHGVEGGVKPGYGGVDGGIAPDGGVKPGYGGVDGGIGHGVEGGVKPGYGGVDGGIGLGPEGVIKPGHGGIESGVEGGVKPGYEGVDGGIASGPEGVIKPGHGDVDGGIVSSVEGGIKPGHGSIDGGIESGVEGGVKPGHGSIDGGIVPGVKPGYGGVDGGIAPDGGVKPGYGGVDGAIGPDGGVKPGYGGVDGGIAPDGVVKPGYGGVDGGIAPDGGMKPAHGSVDGGIAPGIEGGVKPVFEGVAGGSVPEGGASTGYGHGVQTGVVAGGYGGGSHGGFKPGAGAKPSYGGSSSGYGGSGVKPGYGGGSFGYGGGGNKPGSGGSVVPEKPIIDGEIKPEGELKPGGGVDPAYGGGAGGGDAGVKPDIHGGIEIGPEGCVCVPWYQCKDGEIVTDGSGIIDPRKKHQPANELPLEDDFKPPQCGKFHVCCGDPSPHTEKPYEHFCGIRKPSGINKKILNAGRKGESEFGEWPWQGALMKLENKDIRLFQCGAVLIDKRHALTAAHCVNKFVVYDKLPLIVRFGEWDTQVKTEFLPHEDFNVEKIVIHPGFKNTSLWNDIAVLKFDRDVQYAPHIDTICLPRPGDTFVGQECVVTGWGKNAYKGGTYSNVLREVKVPIIDHHSCQDLLRKTRLGKYFRLYDTFTCAGGAEDEDACKGDGGGPLACYRPDGTYSLSGLVSWGIDCGKPNVPGVYVDVSKYLDWIKTVTSYPLDEYWPRA